MDLDNTPLIWLDLETTGLNPNSDTILEIAVAPAILRDPGKLLAPISSFVIGFDGPIANEYVQEMHTKNGLLAECRQSAWSIFDIEDKLLKLFPERPEKYILAGNSVHFDLSFIRTDMPLFAKRLSHRVYDVTAIRMFAASVLGEVSEPSEPAHRAADDVRASILTEQRCASFLAHPLY